MQAHTIKKLFTLETLNQENQQTRNPLSLTNSAKAWPIQPTLAPHKAYNGVTQAFK